MGRYWLYIDGTGDKTHQVTSLWKGLPGVAILNEYGLGLVNFAGCLKRVGWS